MVTEAVTIKGIRYDVIKSETPEDQEAAGRPNLAVHMVKHGVRRYAYLQRPSGQRIYEVVQFENGGFSRMTVLP